MNVHTLGGRVLKAALPMVVTIGLIVAVAPAEAKPPAKPSTKLGQVANLAVTGVTKPDTSYRVASTWRALSGASSYKVSLTLGTTVLTSGTVTTPAWTASTSQAAGKLVTVKVTPMAGNKPGKVASVSTTLPDLTAPTGTFTVAQVGKAGVTVTQTALSDDVTPVGSIVRKVDWNDGSALQAWPADAPLSHTYTVGMTDYHPTVHLVDQAGNSRTVPLDVVHVGDIQAPTGTFTLTHETNKADATVDQTALTDDVTPAETITRTVNWGDSTVESWTTGTTLSHSYTVGLARYTPSVELADEAGNVATVALSAVVVGDITAPVATYAVPASAWAAFTPVQLSESGFDDLSPSAFVTRTVDWGDGSATQQWMGDAAPSHKYAVAGSYTPKVTLVDEAGNASDPISAAAAVTVAKDTGRPTVSLTRPALHRGWVRSWVRPHGKTADAATGVKKVYLRVVEKRGTTWYAYRGTTRTWLKAGRTQAGALLKTRLATVSPTVAKTWSYGLPGLRKGTLVVRVSAVDKVGNKAVTKVYQQALTHS